MPPTTAPMLLCEVEDGGASADCVGDDEGEDTDDVGAAAGSGTAEYGPASASLGERVAALKSLAGQPFWAQGLEMQQPMKITFLEEAGGFNIFSIAPIRTGRACVQTTPHKS
ncbi:MAG: hypothetical protein Q9169_002023 [Polycauliona sp. 2 TL-2023]